MRDVSEIFRLEKASLEIRKRLLGLCTSEVIHIGGDLSICDVMTVLWQYQMKYDPADPGMESRDRFVLSKSHASAVSAFNQAAIGCFTAEDVIREYAKDGGRFSMHSCNLVNPFVEVSTGSLGHGMPVACGIAAALRMKGNSSSRVYTVMGDGEQSEGSIWEAALNAMHYGLGNLVGIVDYNGLSADGALDKLTALDSIAEKYRSFGWRVLELNGHDIPAILDAFDSLPAPADQVPTVMICRTVKGKGVSMMENQSRWHAGKITPEQYVQAVDALQNEFDKKWGGL